MSKNKNEAHRNRAMRPPYQRNIHPFAGSAASGRCVDPAAHAIALDSIAELKKSKEKERARQSKEVTDVRDEILASLKKS